MDIVVDTSVVVAVVANEPERDRLIALTTGAHLIAPHSVHWEVGNAFSAMFKRKRASLATVLKAIQVYRQIPIRFVDVELQESLKIADSLGIYAYDAYLIRCALKYTCPLLSLDKALLVSARRVKAQIVEVR